MKTPKQYIILLIALLCLGALSASGQILTYTHYWYNGKFYTNAGHTDVSGYTTFNALLSGYANPVVRLDSNYSVTESGSILVNSGRSLTIDLNDKELHATGGVGSMFNDKGVINIYNTPGTKVVDNTIYFQKPTGSAYVNTTYTIDKGKIVLCEGVRCAYVNSGGTFNLYSGTITGTSTNVTVPIQEEGGYSSGIMTGLVRNTPETNGDGGAFYVYGVYPGNIAPYSTLKIYGGVITKCSSGSYTYDSGTDKYSTAGWGGAIAIQPNNTGYIADGKIQFCQAGYAAGAICNHGTLTIKNGDFDYNMCVGDYGSFLYLRQGGTLTINGGNYRYGTGGGQYSAGNLGTTGYLIELWASQPDPNTVTITGGLFERSSGSGFFCGGNMGYNLSISGAEIRYNYSNGIRLSSPVGSTTIGNGTRIHHNNLKWKAYEGGGICLSSGSLTLTGNVEVDNNQATRGGGIYADGANGTLTINAGLNVHDNRALQKGGGIYVRNDITMNGGTISNNTATNYGGGICVETPFEVNVRLNGGTISNNTVTAGSGGGLATLKGDFPTEVNYTQSFPDNWGISTFSLAYPATSVVDYTLPTGYTLPEDGGVTINNHLIYIGRTDGTGGPLHNAGNTSVTYQLTQGTKANVYVGNGSTSPSIQGNHANSGNGGGIYIGGGVVNVNAHTAATAILLENTALNGGGIYTAGGTVTFSKGTIKDNYASAKGGGLYIPAAGSLSLTGTSTLTGNHVAAGHLGGGVYLEGTLQAGNSSSDVITVADNYAGTSTILNNVYLPNPDDEVTGTPTTYPGVISVVNNGLNLTNSSIGFSVPHNLVPVIYCANTTYLEETVFQSDAIFEDSDTYDKYYGSDGYSPNFIYLAADSWVWFVNSQPAGFAVDGSGNVTISSAEGLAWLISYVNGMNGQSAHNMSGKTVTLTADVDMAGHGWVPIGIATKVAGDVKTFNGTFNGNGHSISNLSCSFLGDDAYGTGLGLGLFGVLDGATVHDVILNGMEIQVSNQTSTDTYVMGAIANETKNGTNIYNCYASPVMTSTMANTIMGGLVGKLTSGTLKNSFANAKFVPVTGSTFKGGLVGMNSGTVENCYIRVRDAVPATYFGYLAGTNRIESTNGTLQYSYSPVASYVASEGTAGTQTGLGAYGTTDRLNGAYRYLHRDQQITLAVASEDTHLVNGNFSSATGLTGLLATLNHWANSAGAQYARWMRTSASPINDDYPIFKFDNHVCVGTADANNIALDYSNDFSTMFSSYVGDSEDPGVGTIYLYKNAGSSTITTSNSGKATALYIGEDAVLLHNSAIDAHVGIILDNSAGSAGANPTGSGIIDNIDWHFFSSSLSNAPIGLTYGDNEQYKYCVYPSWQACFTSGNGYFPTNLNTGSHVDGDYFGEWDLYAYYEPDYHWINLKRNGNSHWHADLWPGEPEANRIKINYKSNGTGADYTNETNFLAGRGYMVALAQEGYLQAYGTLNNNPSPSNLEVNLFYTEDISWTGRKGLNLLGNPYQSYLNFDQFAIDNSGGTAGKIWTDKTNASYIIMNEDASTAGYVQYAYSQSDNGFGVNRFLHPHQGFMVVAGKSGLKAVFNNGQRNADAATTQPFRDGGHVNYPLVNLLVTDSDGHRDYCTVELGRPEAGGAVKQPSLHTGNGSISCHYAGEDYGVAFTEVGLTEAAIRFVTDEDDEYTLTWNTLHGEFSYLHLIDNMTGTDIDCLTTEEYRFSSQTSDYASRFRLVFGYTGIEEPEEDGPSTSSGTFAFMMGDELVVNGEGRLEIVDMMGRIVKTEVLNGVQNTVRMPRVSAGVYVLRLSDVNGTKTQKIIMG